MRIAVIGAGPSGITAACRASERGHQVILIEKNEKIGKKLYITGKGRCNLTNNAPIEEFIQSTKSNPFFMYSSFYQFTNSDLIKKINALGVPTKVERGRRVFPKSDKSSDVIQALNRWIRQSKVELCLNTQVLKIDKNNIFKIFTDKKEIDVDKVVLATGGLSYPSTGSTGDGYGLARKLGHKLTPLRPSLVSFVLQNPYPECAGITLKNITLQVSDGKRTFSEFGELSFTHKGISGPVVLSLSSEELNWNKAYCEIDLKPALDQKKLDRRILRDFKQYSNKILRNALDDLLIQKLIPIALEDTKLDGEKPVHQITKNERFQLVQWLKHWKMDINSLGDYEEAVITRGGIVVDEINPSTMESTIVPGLYFAGEIIDVDALTGGFNLQIAFSTGYLAGSSC